MFEKFVNVDGRIYCIRIRWKWMDCSRMNFIITFSRSTITAKRIRRLRFLADGELASGIRYSLDIREWFLGCVCVCAPVFYYFYRVRCQFGIDVSCARAYARRTHLSINQNRKIHQIRCVIFHLFEYLILPPFILPPPPLLFLCYLSCALCHARCLRSIRSHKHDNPKINRRHVAHKMEA